MTIECKIKATEAELIIRDIKGKPYYEIKYRTEPDGEYHIGYGSYEFKNIVRWLDECFDVFGDVERLKGETDDNRG